MRVCALCRESVQVFACGGEETYYIKDEVSNGGEKKKLLRWDLKDEIGAFLIINRPSLIF